MGDIKTKMIMNMEEKMGTVKADPMRYEVLTNAKNFKTSWIELGRSLYSVWKDKLYKDWGFSTFDIYSAKEIGIRKQTAVKLLKSYYFLEKEDPQTIEKSLDENAKASSVPSYESVNLLRLASKKEMDTEDYKGIKKKVLDEGRDPGDIRKDLTAIIRKRDELMPEEAWKNKKVSQIKRLIGLLKAVSTEIKVSKVLPVKVITDIEKLITKLNAEL